MHTSKLPLNFSPGLVTGKTPSVKLNKVIAGHEPDKTNEFLQMLALAINMKVKTATVQYS